MSTGHNYTDQSDIDVERVGDVTGKPPTNKATDRNVAAKMANLLEGLEFPVTKAEIKNHLNKKSPSMGNRINDVFEAVENKLNDYTKYDSVYDIELAAGLVNQAGNKEKPHVRNRAPKKANAERIGEDIKHHPYAGHETIGPASSKNVSPNTSKGEEV
jgi:hypothetical protein